MRITQQVGTLARAAKVLLLYTSPKAAPGRTVGATNQEKVYLRPKADWLPGSGVGSKAAMARWVPSVRFWNRYAKTQADRVGSGTWIVLVSWADYLGAILALAIRIPLILPVSASLFPPQPW